MSKEELRVLNQNHNRPKKRVPTPTVPPIEYSEPKLSPIDDEKLITMCLSLHKATYNEKTHVKLNNSDHSSSFCLFSRINRISIGNDWTNLVKKESCNAFNSACKCLEMMNYPFKNVHIY